MENPGHDAVRFEPPNVSPAVAAVLVGHRDDAHILSALIMDMSARQWFTIEPYSGGWALRSAAHLPGYGTLTSAEKLLLDAVFIPSLVGATGENLTQQYVSLTTLKHRLSGCAHAIAVAVGDEMVRDGLAARNPVTASAFRGKALTTSGAAAREAAQGFKRYLETAEAGALQFATQSWHVERYLSFAVAFNIADRWIRSLEAGSTCPGCAALSANPVVIGAVAAVDGGFTLEALFTASVVTSYVNTGKDSRR